MQNIFLDTRPLDKNAIEKFDLTEDILMENAAMALESEVINLLDKIESHENLLDVLIVTGSRNNGADGLALARRLFCSKNKKEDDISVGVFCYKQPKSNLCIEQAHRAEKCGVKFLQKIQSCKILVDCIVGSGITGDLDEKTQLFVQTLNNLQVCKGGRIACDVPTGFLFNSDITVTMGSLKLCLFDDHAKNIVGKIVCGNLGISQKVFEFGQTPCAYLLESKDMQLPIRNIKNVHKGSFGYTSVICSSSGSIGAQLIAAKAAFAFGAGLVSLVCIDDIEKENLQNIKCLDPQILVDTKLSTKTTSIAFGMGFGINEKGIDIFNLLSENQEISLVLDADVFYYPELKKFLEKRTQKIVLTPHPKEFQSLLEICDFGNFSIDDILKNKFDFIKKFCLKYRGIILLLKGANPVIGMCDADDRISIFINTFGSPCLAKGGSGDVLSGMIASLLSQGYSPLSATISASLAHAFASQNEQKKSSYGMTPLSLIESVRLLSDNNFYNLDL